MKPRLIVLSIIFCCLVFVSCGKKEMALEFDRIKDYHALFLNSDSAPAPGSNVDFYLDFTVGINVAFNDQNTKSFFDAVIKSMRIDAIDLYVLASDTIKPDENSTKETIYAKLRDPGNFKEAFAPLDKALNTIVAGNNFSIMVTDGELWLPGQGELASTNPWARDGFARWLAKGNKIDFYITDHMDAGKMKHLFYMLFIPKNTGGQKLPSDDITYFLKNDIDARNLKYTSFSFSTDFYNLKQDYSTVASSGACDELAVAPDTTSFINGFDQRFEYLDFALDWKNIDKYIRNAQDENTGNPIPGGKDLIRKLFFDAKHNQLYQVDGIGVKVYDIYDDYQQYEFCEQCKTQPPVFQLDEKGNKQLDLNNNNLPIILEEGLYGCYDESGELLAEMKYTGPKIKEVLEMYVFDDNLFNYTYIRDTVGEISLKIHPNFNGTQVSDQRENLQRVDIVITKCTPKTDNPNLEKFIWEGKQIKTNRALYESIILAIKDTNPEGKVIYSYYIKSLPNNYYE